jgi:hypothetical protein
MDGAPQGSLKSGPVRHVMTSRPYCAPTMKPAFRIDGKTTTQSALSSSFWGMLSGILRISVSTLPASLIRSSSLFFVVGGRAESKHQHRDHDGRSIFFSFMKFLQQLRCLGFEINQQ